MSVTVVGLVSAAPFQRGYAGFAQMPNTFAFIALLSWPLVVVVLFRSMALPKALCWSLIAGYLLLPERAGFNFPFLPAINKTSVPSLAALVMCLGLAYRDRIEAAWSRRSGGMGPGALLSRLRSVPRPGGARLVFYILLGLVIVAPVVTVLTNREPVFAGPRVLRGLTLHDMGSMVQGSIIMLLPFMLAMRFLATSSRHVILLTTLAVAGLAYTLPMLVELRMSPQMSNWVYGFFPHQFIQHIRALGWRPVVFLHHGLLVGIFMAGATLAACALWRQALRDRIAAAPWTIAAVWLLVMLVMSSNFGATALVLLLAPVILLTPPRLQIVVAAVLAGFVLLFPMMRGAGLVPTDAVVSSIARVAPVRASSLEFRFRHEDWLLNRAAQKPLAGWGGWGRNRIFSEETGQDLSVSDGAWVIIIGQTGWVGYVALFGLLTIPTVLLALRRRDRLTPATTGLALIGAASAVDQIPNASLTPITFLVAGALAGRFLHEEYLVDAHAPGRSATPAPAGRSPDGQAEAGSAMVPNAGTQDGNRVGAAGGGRHIRRSRGAPKQGPAGTVREAATPPHAPRQEHHLRSPRVEPARKT